MSASSSTALLGQVSASSVANSVSFSHFTSKKWSTDDGSGLMTVPNEELAASI